MLGVQQVGIFAAFLAGLLSFFSPCVLPLVPTYLAFISGLSLEELKSRKGKRSRAVVASLLFISGFTLIFILLGATATALGGWLFRQGAWLGRIGGAVIILLGLHLSEILPLPFISRERRFVYRGRAGLLGAPIIGMAFAFGWSPCVGPVLAAILGLAAGAQTVGRGILLLLLYSVGLAIPFFAAALAVERFLKFFEKAKRYLQFVNIFAGKLLVIMGLLLVAGRFDAVTSIGHFDWSVAAAGLMLLLYLLVQIRIMAGVQRSIAAAGIGHFPKSVIVLFYLDALALAIYLLAGGLLSPAA